MTEVCLAHCKVKFLKMDRNNYFIIIKNKTNEKVQFVI